MNNQSQLTTRGRYTGADVSHQGTSYDEINRASVEAFLQLAARGHALLAALQHTIQRIPMDDLTPSKHNRFTPLLLDCAYLVEPTPLSAHAALDAEFRAAHAAICHEAYRVLEGMVQLHKDLCMLLQQLQEGVFLHTTLEQLLLGFEGRQVAIEAVANLGALQLLLHNTLPALVRERLLIAHMRFQGGPQALGPLLQDVVALVSRPQGTPAQALTRLPVPPEVVGVLVGCLKSDDVYGQLGHFPSHRCIALSQQAGLVYLLLYMRPDLLHRDLPLMRMLVDRHFADTWCVMWAPGQHADLAVEWEPFKAARIALSAVITTTRARQLSTSHAQHIPDLTAALHTLSTHLRSHDAADYVLTHASAACALLRRCYVTLHWCLLQGGASVNRKLREAVVGGGPGEGTLVGLLVEVAAVDAELRRLYAQVLGERGQRWARCCQQAHAILEQLSAWYTPPDHQQPPSPPDTSTSTTPTTPSPPTPHHDDDLAAWFHQCAARVARLADTPPPPDAMELRRVVAAVREVQSYHKIQVSYQASQSLMQVQELMGTLTRLATVREETMMSLAAVGDVGYAWGLLNGARVQVLQAHLRNNPHALPGMICALLKFRTVMELPLLRLTQASSAQASMVAAYYTTQLVEFVQDVLQVVPVCIVELLESMAHLLTSSLTKLPPRLPKDKLSDVAHLPQRAQLTSMLDRIATYTQGFTTHARVMIGIEQVNLLSLFHTNLDTQLQSTLTTMFDRTCAFDRNSHSSSLLTFWHGTIPPTLAFIPPSGGHRGAPGNVQELHDVLLTLRRQVMGMQRALLLAQDVLGVQGMGMWGTAMTAVMRQHTILEATRLQPPPTNTPTNTPTPSGGPLVPSTTAPVGFLGQLGAQLLLQSDPWGTLYCEGGGGEWKTRAQGSGRVLSMSTWRVLAGALHTAGLLGMDALYATRAAQILQHILHTFHVLAGGALEHACRDLVQATGAPVCEGYPVGGLDAYTNATAAAHKEGQAGALVNDMAALGQCLLLRKAIAMQVRLLAEDGGGAMAVDLLVVEQQQQQQQKHSGGGDGGHSGGGHQVHGDVSDMQQLYRAAGLYDTTALPITPSHPPSSHAPHVLFMVLLTCVYNVDALGGLLPEHSKQPDAEALVRGLALVLRHVGGNASQELASLVSQCVRTLLQASNVISSRTSMDLGYRRQAGTLAAMMQGVGRAHNHKNHNILNTWTSNFVARGA